MERHSSGWHTIALLCGTAIDGLSSSIGELLLMTRSHSRRIRSDSKLFSLCLGALLAGLVGCGGKPATVTGVVMLDGKPLERGTVGFAPTAGGMRAVGTIQSDGSYELKTNRDVGLEVGEYAVTVKAREPGKENPHGGPPMPGPYIAPRKYASARTSGLVAQVAKGSNEFDFDLSSEGLEEDKARRGRR